MTLRAAFKVGIAGTLGAPHRLIRRLRAPRVYVLAYHRVVERVRDDGPIIPSLCISADSFRRQMEQARRELEVLTLSEALAAIDGTRPLERDAFAVTFDDGYRDVFLRAAPILADLRVPATLFVPSGFVGTRKRFVHDRLYSALWRRRAHADAARMVDELIARHPADHLEAIASELERRAPTAPAPDDETRVLEPRELRALADAGWEIGAHTVDHRVLVHEPEDRVEDQLLLPKIDLESWTGRPCRYFAYCNGHHTPQLVSALKRCGYEGAVTTCDRPNRRGGDRFRVARKVLWEGHARGPRGRWSAALSSAHLHDLFGALGLTRPIDGEARGATHA
jgi:peptidoglycan/xylan/chitin deacetylase (PgdA/CDA1 family)